MKAYYRKLESKKAGKVSYGVFKNAKRMSGLKKYIKKQRISRKFNIGV
jgi:hypothetical protein